MFRGRNVGQSGLFAHAHQRPANPQELEEMENMDDEPQIPAVPPGMQNEGATQQVWHGPATLRRFCFTYFLEPEESFLALLEPDNAYVRRAVWQEEITPSTGLHHIQGYVELTQPRQFLWIKTHLVPASAHVEKTRGSAKQNYEYCTKDETRAPGEAPVIVGDWSDMAGSRYYGYQFDAHLYHRSLSLH